MNKTGEILKSDYDILKIVLQKICQKKTAREVTIKANLLIDRFGSLIAVLGADYSDIIAMFEPDDPDYSASYFKLLHDIFARVLMPKKCRFNILDNLDSLLSYSRFLIGFKKKEHFIIFFLDKDHYQICNQVCDFGTVDKIAIYPREIVKSALTQSATSIILVHNHPSGDVTPSIEDLHITLNIIHSLGIVNIALYDHFIVSRRTHFSFRAEGFITNLSLLQQKINSKISTIDNF